MRVLSSHVIKSKRVLNEGNCQIYCYLEANCVSYNYGPAEDELYLCELSDKNHLQIPSVELEARHGFIYRPVTPVSKLKKWCPRSINHKRALHAYYLSSIVKSKSKNYRGNSNNYRSNSNNYRSNSNNYRSNSDKLGSELMIKTLNNRTRSI